MRTQQNGYILVMLVFLMSILSIIGLHALSIFRSESIERSDFIKTSQAFGIAEGGLNWALLYYSSSEDWVTSSNAINGSSITLNSNCFDLSVQNVTSRSATVFITGNAQSGDHFVVRTMELLINQNNTTGTLPSRRLSYSWKGN